MESGTVFQEMFTEATFNQNNFLFIFSHFCDTKSKFSYLICSHMRRLAIQTWLKCTGTLQIVIDPHPSPIGISYSQPG
jgi:hypothetical protein